MVPITADQGKVRTYIYLGYLTKDPATGKVSLAYIEPARLTTHSGSVNTNGVYGPVLTGVNVGDTVTPMSLNAQSPYSLTQNSGDTLGSAFLYFSEWDYFGSSTVTSGWSSNGVCYSTKYLLYQTNYEAYLTGSSFTYAYKSMKGIVCFADSGTSVSGLVLTISEGYIPAKWGLILPGFGGYSNHVGNLLSRRANNNNVPAVLAITNTSAFTTPTMGPLLEKSIGKWVIDLQVPIDDDVEIIMTGNLGTTNLPFTSSSGTCSIYLGSTKLPVGCIYTSNPTEVDYILTIHEAGLLPKNSQMSIIHYGLTTNSTYNTITYDIKCYSLVYTTSPGANDLIFEASGLSFNYNADDTTYLGQSAITFSDFSQTTNNKVAITSF